LDLKIFQVDAFADEVFKGNPAAVVPLESWLPDETLLAIAMENNLSETAYIVPHEDGTAGHYYLRWFAPNAEVEICGHATLGTAYVLFEFLGISVETLAFETRSGTLEVSRGSGGMLSMDFPAQVATDQFENAKVLADYEAALGAKIKNPLMRGPYSLFVLEKESDIRDVRDIRGIASALDQSPFWGLLITAPADEGREYDFISRFFAPGKGVPEDPVTGSTHCMLAPYWADRLGKNETTGYQASPRGGYVHCVVNGDRVTLSGKVAPYLKGTISI